MGLLRQLPLGGATNRGSLANGYSLPSLFFVVRTRLRTMPVSRFEDGPHGPEIRFEYPRSLEGEYGAHFYVPPSIRLAFGARSSHEPAGHYEVLPYAAEVLSEHFTDPVCRVLTLRPKGPSGKRS